MELSKKYLRNKEIINDFVLKIFFKTLIDVLSGQRFDSHCQVRIFELMNLTSIMNIAFDIYFLFWMFRL